MRETWIARVVAVDGKTQRLRLDRPLRTDVRLAWRPGLYPARSSVEEIGIEHLAIEFPVTPYRGHFTELGYNAIAYVNIRNGWVRDVEIRHADSGMFIGGANTTVTGVVWISDREPNAVRNSTGHHGIELGGTDLLLSHFDFRTRFIHDITMTRGSAGNVVRKGRGEDLSFDHHKYANHANLFTDLDAGVGTNIFYSGGGRNWDGTAARGRRGGTELVREGIDDAKYLALIESLIRDKRGAEAARKEAQAFLDELRAAIPLDENGFIRDWKEAATRVTRVAAEDRDGNQKGLEALKTRMADLINKLASAQ